MRYVLLVSLLLLVAPELEASSFVPPLPDGLQDDKEKNQKNGPALPKGLADSKAPPSLPPGLGGKGKRNAEESVSSKASPGLPITGFAEIRTGFRLQDDPFEKAASIGEARLQLSLEKEFELGTATLTADMVVDPVWDRHGINLESGRGWLDLREANFLMRPTSFADLKLGRQILTWGTGDLLFINDMFPKDWNAFFIGRDTEYLKAPSDTFKLALFSDTANLDIIYTPRFDADRYIDGSRISYFNPMLSELSGQNALIQANRPDDWFKSDEWSLRLYRNLGAAEVALYFYDGYWKSPAGQETTTGLAKFPRLRTYGASIRRPLLGGIANIEIGLYDSLDDPTGANPFIGNSEFRWLVGFEREIASELTASVQYYQESIRGYDAYQASLPTGLPVRDKNRRVLTARLTKFTMNQTLTWSLFAYYSPTDKDAYLRPKVSYKIDDAWLAEVGANLFFGAANNTFFGQFKKNTNLFAGLRYSF